MRRRLAKNRVRLRLREGGAPRGLGDSPHVVAGVVIEGGKHLVRADAHVGEELDAVGDAALLVRHHAIEETVRSLARRHGGEVGPAHAGWRAERGRDRLSGLRIRARTSRENQGDEREEREAGDRPGHECALGRTTARAPARHRGAGGGAAAMAEPRTGDEGCLARGALRALEGVAAGGAEAPGRGGAAGGAGRSLGGGHGKNLRRRWAVREADHPDRRGFNCNCFFYRRGRGGTATAGTFSKAFAVAVLRASAVKTQLRLSAAEVRRA